VGTKKEEKEEIFNDDDEDGDGKAKDKIFSEMRETRTGFGAKGAKNDYSPG